MPVDTDGPTALCSKPRIVVLPPAKNRSVVGTNVPIPFEMPRRTAVANTKRGRMISFEKRLRRSFCSGK